MIKVSVKNEKHINRIDLLCLAEIGIWNDEVLNKVIELNPERNFLEEEITLGDVIYLPERLEIYGN